MGDVVIESEHDGTVVRFSLGRRRIVVDTRDHDLVVTVDRKRPLRVAASRAGIADAVLGVNEALNDETTDFDEAIEAALRRALFAAARRRGVDIEPVYAAVNAVYPTVFPCCRGIVCNTYLQRDVVRFPAAAAAVGGIEDDAVRDRTVPEQTDAWAYRLRDWRALYVHPQSSARSVNRTLSLYGDEASPLLQWGLRRVVMTAPLPSIQHVDVLGALGMIRDNEGNFDAIDPRLQEMVLKASSQQLGEALVLADEADSSLFSSEVPAVRLAEILTGAALGNLWEGRRRRTFSMVFEDALDRLRALLASFSETIRPPIPLPGSPGIMFLSTARAIVQEGAAMGHCVATRAPRALAGMSYLFHIEHAGARATAEVSREGKVLEVRGPCNSENAAVHYATRELERWAARIAWSSLGAPETSLWAMPGPAEIPPGYVPIHTLGMLQAAMASFTMHREPGDDAVWSWALMEATEALAESGPRAARRWLVAFQVEHVTFQIAAIDAHGTIVHTATAVREMFAHDDDFEDRDVRARNPLHLPPREDHLPPPDEDDNNDDDWEAWT